MSSSSDDTTSTTTMTDSYEYMSGFGNEFETEALDGALPKGQNSPQRCPYGLFAEQLSGSAFTVPRDRQQRSWLYRVLPTVAMTGKYEPLEGSYVLKPTLSKENFTPQQLRWSPADLPGEEQSVNWYQGLQCVCGAGDPSQKSGLAMYVYAINAGMENEAFYSADGDILIVPQHGALDITTEMGKLLVQPGEIAVVQRGIKYAVDVPEGPARGYALEVYNGHFRLPDLGPIGSNGLANPRDFQTPVAAYEDRDCEFKVVGKYAGELYTYMSPCSVFNVVAWHGNYAPYKYDLSLFMTHNTVSFDHTDPSIFTVLTCPSNEPGVAVADFVIFPERWVVQEHSFRPPYYHRNTMSEFMGLIKGEYDAKEQGSAENGFFPGGASLHSCMSGHGPDEPAFEKASNAKLEPMKYENTLAFMFETTYMLALGDCDYTANKEQSQYWECWKDLRKRFDPENIKGKWDVELEE